MRKTLFFTKLGFHKTEETLSYMEKSGYRLTSIHNFGQFEFAESASKEVKYFFVYNYMKEHKNHELEDTLKSEFNANPIDGMITADDGVTRVYRITDTKSDLSELYAERDAYLLHVFFVRLLISISFLSIFTLALISGEGDISRLFSIAAIALLVLVFWNTIGVITLLIRRK